MPRLFGKPISFFTKQLLGIIAINLLILAIASGLIYSSFVDDYRDNLLNIMQSKATLLSATSSSALLFNDNQAAHNILASLAQYPAMRFAQIYDANKAPFAGYSRAGLPVDVSLDTLTLGSFFSQDNVYLFSRIQQGSDVLGYLLLSADTDSLLGRQQRYGRIVIWVFVLSLLLAYLLNWRLQKRMLAPITQLSKLVGSVAQQGLYHKRLAPRAADEIGTLITGVNSMLDTIQEHQKQLRDHNERLEGVVELKTTELFTRANYDALTQLPNRHLLTDRLTHGIENARRENTELALMFLDLDRFKVINDSLGHAIGDQLLEQVAAELTEAVRKSDTVGRWGGDEFVILLEHVEDKNSIEKIAWQIIDKITQPMLVGGHQLHVSASIGIARYPQDGIDAANLLLHADTSMYKAKVQGPGKCHFFTYAMLDASIERLSLETQVRQATKNKAFTLFYQPKISLSQQNFIGLEALIRMNNGDQYVSPTAFLPVAEDVGLMHSISIWVLNEACQQNAAWLEAGLPIVPVAVNLPVSFLLDQQCVEHIEQALCKAGLAPEFLEVEITENTFMASTELAIEVLKKLRKLGVNVAIDDFGTGYSCLAYLRDLPIGTLKIDGTFVKGLGKKSGNDGIVQTIITLGRGLGLELVAEGVEQQYQVDILAAMGCSVFQGYYFSRPLNATDMATYLGKPVQGFKAR
ncbi:MAG: diguanylate cyclase (GGDEF)-like protein [Paraglaciecola sp.]|jgi:diguanylate cyclase (GGDEF)-like protein